MELPVDNKSQVVLHIMTIFFLIIVTGFVIYINSFNIVIIYVALALILLDAIVGIILLKKNDIKRVVFANDKIVVTYRKGDISIPLSELIDIDAGLNHYISTKGKLTVTYILHFRTKYIFGNKLYLKYNFPEVDINNNDPLEIKILKANINNKNHETI